MTTPLPDNAMPQWKGGARRVVITGLGAVTPLGNSVQETWKHLTEGKSGVARITIFDAAHFPTQIAGEVKNLDFSKWTRKNGNAYLGRNSLFALDAVEQALTDSKLGKNEIATPRAGIYFGAGDCGFDFKKYAAVVAQSMQNGSGVDVDLYMKNALKGLDAKAMLEQEPSQVVNHLVHEFPVKGPVSNCLTACAASSQAVGEASRLIRQGVTDVMIAGGSHSMIHPLGVAGFNLLTALSTKNENPQKASKPFDKERDGFVLSEGSGVVILEELEHAKKRGAPIYGELIGYGGTADAFRLTDPHPDGRGAIQAMKLALKDAGIGIGDIQNINAHGTSTELNDQIETLAVKQVFGGRAKSIPMNSIKSMLGHMIAAAGVVELIASVLTIQNNLIPPTINYEHADPNCDLDYVPNAPRRAKVDTILSNSFGFGGQNIALIVTRFGGR